ncbi:MAG: hypothetical protein K8R60_20785 [Burkholderiales bacterium]|nr:hypothetical protein [Burkholderiales bacterium]
MQDGMAALQALGFTWPSPAYIVGAILFGVVGLFAYYWGKRRQRKTTRWLGLALMLYPYVVPQTWALYAIGVALSGAAWFYRDR